MPQSRICIRRELFHQDIEAGARLLQLFQVRGGICIPKRMIRNDLQPFLQCGAQFRIHDLIMPHSQRRTRRTGGRKFFTLWG